MDLSTGTQSLDHIKFLKSRNSSISPKPEYADNDLYNDIIDLSRLNFGSDETWLCSSSINPDKIITDLHSWLHKDLNDIIDNDSGETDYQFVSPKNIDTRTFTRPKKRFTRPSIEKYNEEMYGSQSDSCESASRRSLQRDSLIIQENCENVIPSNSFHFDLSQPTNSDYFDNILANCGEGDSFQNMSPPSLVNSMCSSTFANLMESSFIKNDPVLREIRDADYTDNVLLQDSEPPMFQSFTGSCSSINSDTPEMFLKRISNTGSFRRNLGKEMQKVISAENTRNATFINDETDRPNDENDTTFHTSKIDKTLESNNYSATYRRTPKIQNGTFKKSDLKNVTITVNASSPELYMTENFQNRTQTLIKDCSIRSFEGTKTYNNIKHDDTIENIKNELSDSLQIKDLNRLSYCLEDESMRLDSGYTEINNEDLNRTANKRSSIGCSTGSADSLDRMSSISNSSRESNRILNMADVDAIVEKQEQSLNQVMSTPKPHLAPKRFLENNFISPIVPLEPLSDSDLSSNDDYRSAKSSNSKISLENYSGKTKSMGYLAGSIETNIKTSLRTTLNQRPLQATPQNLRSSYSNLQKSSQTSSYQNLYRLSSTKLPSSNLKSMGTKLKGSYTSLRPASAHLPVAPPLINSNLNSTNVIVPRLSSAKITHVVENSNKGLEVNPILGEQPEVIGDNTFIRPPPPKSSGLPRPTGIPRPASRIPAPRTSILRPASSRTSLIKKESYFQ